MRIIGVTGPSGSGKSLLSKYFSDLGVTVIDADALYHSMLIPPSPCLDAIREKFGDGVISADGSLDRSALSKVVFNSPEKLRLLNRTVLTLVLDEIRARLRALEADGVETVIIDAPTLIESGFHLECDTVVSVIAPVDDRIARICHRDGISREKATERVRAQKEDSFYTEHSQEVVLNDSTEEAFTERLSALARTLKIFKSTPREE